MSRLRPVAALAAAGLAGAVPFSNPDGTGMQWDEGVLFLLASWACWQLLRTAAGLARRTALPWRVLGAGAGLFAVAQGLEAAFPGPAFDGFGVDKVLLFAGACTPLVTCGLLALRVRRTRWTALVVDGLTTTVGLFVVSEVVATPGVLVHLDPGTAPPDLRSMVLLYGGYAAVALGAAGALCTVSTAALRRPATAALGAVAGQAAAAACEAMAIVAPSPLWTAGSDAAVAAGLLLFVHAARVAPRTEAPTTARAAAPAVSSLGMALVVLGLLAPPLALGATVASGQPVDRAAELGCAVVLLLVAVRVVLRLREDGRVTEDLVRTEEDFRSLVESSSDGVAIVDGELRLLFTSPAARRLLGTDGESGAVALPDLVTDDTRPVLLLGLLDGSAADGSLHVHVATADGTRELQVQTAERPGGDRRVLYLRDVTTRRRRERELERMAYTDHLTGLPNRALLFSELDDVPAAGGDPRCLLVLDLDGFKAVNDRAGHESGDHLLVEVGRRLSTVVRDDDLVARLGGDEFAVLVAGSLEESVEVAQRLVDALALPFLVDGEAFGIGGSVGVARIGAGGGRLAFREADAALRTAKQAGKGCLRVAGTGAAPAAGADVAGALAREELEVRFDAVVDGSGRPVLVHGVPVWRHPELGAVRGSELWAAAEAQGVAPALQRWLLRRAAAAVAALPAPLDVAVSLPGGPVPADDLADEVRTALADAGLPAGRLVLSFSEETLLTSSAALVPALEAVRATGVRLCLDGYGMGQSLFALLARVPLDVVRADLAALAGRDDTARMVQVLDAVLHITGGFGITVIAGGLSTPELLEHARAAGVALAHGRALPHDLDGAGLAALVADRLAAVLSLP